MVHLPFNYEANQIKLKIITKNTDPRDKRFSLNLVTVFNRLSLQNAVHSST